MAVQERLQALGRGLVNFTYSLAWLPKTLSSYNLLGHRHDGVQY